jgi:imidazolonepropionase-like amidohydrolase
MKTRVAVRTRIVVDALEYHRYDSRRRARFDLNLESHRVLKTNPTTAHREQTMARWIPSIKKLTIIIFASLLLAVANAQTIPNRASERTWITDVYLVSPERLDRIEKGSVLIENGRITRVERTATAKKPAGARVVLGAGQFLIPGLIDSHVHLASIPGVQPEVSFGPADQKPAMIKEYLKQLPRSYLYFGYTTLVDLAVIDRRALDDFRQSAPHPDLYDCGQSLPFANGYPMAFAPPGTRFRLFPNFIYDPNQASNIPSEYKPQDHTPAADVASVKSSGGVCVKAYFERGFGAARDLPVITPDIAADLRKASTQAGLVLMMHANSFEAQKFAVDGNVDVIAHGMWNWGSFEQQSKLPAEIKAVLDRIVEKKIGYQATIQVIGGMQAYFDPEYLNTNAVRSVIPSELLAWFKSPEGKWFKKELAAADASDAVAREGFERGPIRRVQQVVAYLAAKDANFVFGTDTPSSPTYGNLPGLNGYLEMRQLLRAGLSLKQIFRAATINNAREFKLDSQVGTIEPGKIANLVLLKKSPLESVEAYDTIVTVWVHGREMSRESLAANASK